MSDMEAAMLCVGAGQESRRHHIVINGNCAGHHIVITFIPSKDEILVKNTPTSLHEKKTGWRQWILSLIFCVDVHMVLDPSLPPSTRVHLSLTPPLRVDVINGWPLRCFPKRHSWLQAVIRIFYSWHRLPWWSLWPILLYDCAASKQDATVMQSLHLTKTNYVWFYANCKQHTSCWKTLCRSRDPRPPSRLRINFWPT